MLKRKKGFNIVNKSLRCKLHRDGFDLFETKTAFNEVVFFYFLLINEYPEGLDIKEIAYRDYGILTTRVNPRDTSRLDPWGEKLWRGQEFPINLLDYLEYQPGAFLVANTAGYRANSGINAARNIGLKVIGRYRTNPYFRRGKPELEIAQVCNKT